MNWEQIFYITGIIFFGVNLLWWTGVMMVVIGLSRKMKRWQEQIEIERQAQAKKAVSGAKWLWFLWEMYRDWKRIKADGKDR